jgi:hypothetical protein
MRGVVDCQRFIFVSRARRGVWPRWVRSSASVNTRSHFSAKIPSLTAERVVTTSAGLPPIHT